MSYVDLRKTHQGKFMLCIAVIVSHMMSMFRFVSSCVSFEIIEISYVPHSDKKQRLPNIESVLKQRNIVSRIEFRNKNVDGNATNEKRNDSDKSRKRETNPGKKEKLERKT